MVKKKALGRGMSNLIKDTEMADIVLKDEKNGELINVSIEDVEPNLRQARKFFDEEKISDLAKSIKEYGIIQPLVLRKENDKYVIIAGERRYRAAKKAGIKNVPAIIKSVTKEDADKISLIENVQRQDLNPIEEAFGYKELMKEYNITQEELAGALGKSRQYIGNTVRMLKLDERVIKYIEEGLLTTSHAKLLLSIKDKELQYKEANRIIKSGSTVIEARDSISIEDKEKKKEKEDIYIENARRELSEVLGTKVSFKGSGKVKRIEIEYYCEDDLSRICETILRGEV